MDWDKFNWESVEEIRGRNRIKKVLKYVPSDGLYLDVGTGRGDGTYLISLKIAAKKNGNLIQADACNLPIKKQLFLKDG
jgi:hypothetical protein